MNSNEYDTIASEITLLKEILDEIPEEEVIERIGLEYRLEEAKSQIAKINPKYTRQKAVLTFRGTPVSGSYSIAADFAVKATGAFTDAITTVATGIAGNLRYMEGRLSNREQNQLVITGTAIGSFGFEFEVPKCYEDTLIPCDSEVGTALRKMQSLFRETVEGSDDSLTELVEEIHPRAVKKVVNFLEILKDRDAWCAFSFQHDLFRFNGTKQVTSAIERLSETNIHEKEKEYKGELQGALPKKRTFEFKVGDDILHGKIGDDIQDIIVLNRKYLYKPSCITLKVIQVGQGRPRYALEKFENIKLIESEIKGSN